MHFCQDSQCFRREFQSCFFTWFWFYSVLITLKSSYPLPANYLVQRTLLPSSFVTGICKTSMKVPVLRVFLDFSRHEIHGCFIPLFFFFPGRRLLVRWLKFWDQVNKDTPRFILGKVHVCVFILMYNSYQKQNRKKTHPDRMMMML